MQLASRNPLLRTACRRLGNFLQGLLGHPRSNSKLARNCRENMRKYPYPQTPAVSRGASEEKQTPKALVFGSREASLLEAWLLHLDLD